MFNVRSELFTAVTMSSSEMLRRAALVKTDVSEEYISSIIMVEIINELGTLAGTSN
jgi:hypothetical protein